MKPNSRMYRFIIPALIRISTDHRRQTRVSSPYFACLKYPRMAIVA
jgi:hypothetical protein